MRRFRRGLRGVSVARDGAVAVRGADSLEGGRGTGDGKGVVVCCRGSKGGRDLHVGGERFLGIVRLRRGACS